ncbi:unnamed protein product [Chironomus riparius]|uniref:Uncharacterized protein n=1 Tax=Chironomus riparius TaxID=315576 RepID=A0A9N9S7F8_9DIPT|nr:unnamed protein product [Chironomus riparius]
MYGDLCRFCLSNISDKSAVSLKNHEILVCVDKKLIDLKEILKFLLLNYSYCENLPNLICNECKNIIIKYYSLKKTFLENEKTLTAKSQTVNKHQKLHNLISIVEEFCRYLNDEDSLNVLNYSDRIVIEKCAEERVIEDDLLDHTKKENIPNQVIIQTIQEDEEEATNYIQYVDEEYIDNESLLKCESQDLIAAQTMKAEHEQQEIFHEDDLQYQVNAESSTASQETEYEIQFSDPETLENEEDCDKSSELETIYENENLPLNVKLNVRNKRKHKVIQDNLENGLIAKKYKVSLVDSNVVVQEDDETNSFMCSNCSSVFTNEKAANDHVMRYGKFQFCTLCRCDECSVIFSSQKSFQKHKSFHILSKISSIFNYYDCLHCNVSFGNDKDYEKHIECHAENENYLYSFDGKPQLEGCELFKSNKDELMDENSWTCGHCGLRFGLKNDLNFHMTLFHASLYCPFDRQQYGKSVSYLIDHLKMKHAEQFGNEEITFSCSHCFEEFSAKNEMKEHEKYCDSKKFDCHHCEKKFALERQLKEHLEAVNGTMKFTCSSCKKKFNNRSSLTVHLRIHSKERPYICTFDGCNKAFRTNSHRSSHMDAHNETKNYKCQYCELLFQTRAAKRTHEKSHSYSHICPLCHKDFKQRSHLVRHANIVHKIICGSANLEAEIDKMDEGRIKF